MRSSVALAGKARLRTQVAAATTPIMMNFQDAARKPASTENSPFFAATAATPPTISAASPYSATLSPLRQSA